MSRIGMMDPFGQQQVGQAQLPKLSPQEEDSLLGKIGGKVMGGLGMVGDFLDKYTGGRAVRGVLGGRPEDLLSLLPFSDALGITDESKKITGRDLADQWGLSSKGSDSWGDAGLGVAADLLTNPATYLSLGGSALTEAGEKAAKIGVRGKTIRDRIKGVASLSPEQDAAANAVGINAADIAGKPLGGVLGIGLPFSKPSVVLGAGPSGEKFLDAVGSVGRGIASVPGVKQVVNAGSAVLDPVNRHFQALFNRDVQGATSAAGQTAGRSFTAGTEAALNALRGKEAQVIRGLEGGGALDLGSQLRQVAERTASANPLLPQGQALGQAATALKDIPAALDAEGATLGFAPHKLVDSEIEYAARQQARLPKDSPGYGGRSKQALPIRVDALEPREEILRNIPGGTEQINRLALDPELSGVKGRFGPSGMSPAGSAPTTPATRAALVRERYLGISPAEEATIPMLQSTQAAGGALTPAEEALLAKWQQSHGLADWAASLDPKYLESGTPVFGNHPIQDAMSIAAKKAQRNEAGKAVHELFASTAKPAAEAGPGWVRLGDALAGAGFDDLASAQAYQLSKLGQRTSATLTPQSVLDWYVPPESLRDANRFQQGLQVPAALQPLVNGLDWITNLTKAGQTALWPGFHARNATSGVAMNAGLGVAPTEIGTAQTLLRGGTVAGAKDIPYLQGLARQLGRPLSDEEATKELANLAYQYRASSGGIHEASEATGAAQAQALKAKLPGLDPFEGFGAALKQAIPGSLEEANPLNLRGVSANEDLFAPVVAGRKIGGAVEDTNRLSGFIGLLKQGYHPEEAARLVNKAHVDYGALSDFEKEVMRRVVPFYSFARGNTANVVSSLAEKPGGLYGSLAQTANELRQGDTSFVPDYLGGGLALPMGKEQDGTQRFLTKVDTPVEAAFDKLRPTLSGSLMAMLGDVNPVLKAPLEYATGKQFMSGRNLGDLYPITGSTLVDQTIMNSPLGRAYTTGRTLTDPRKDLAATALNLGTGVKVSDVDLEKARDLLARDYLAEQLRGQQGVGRSESYYLRPGALDELTPEQVVLLRLEKNLDARNKGKGRIGVPSR